MTQTLSPYLNFRGRAREAMERYRDVFGGDLELLTFEQGGMAAQTDEPQQIMHGHLLTPAGMRIMGADVPPSRALTPGENHFSLALMGSDRDALHGYWTALADGAAVVTPLAPAPWGDEYGELVDRFGTPWSFDIAAAGD